MWVTGWSGWPWVASAVVVLVAGVVAGLLAGAPEGGVPEPGRGEPSAGNAEEGRPTPGSDAAGQETIDVVAVGDIASCGSDGDEATAALAMTTDGPVLALGDLAYNSGSPKDFAECYDPSWGPLVERTRPVPGNHEYRTAGATGYFEYFGGRAGTPGEGWYSYDLGTWHVVALNSNCNDVECGPGSAQEGWLRADLRANAARCTLAYWHHPPFSSGAKHGGTKDVEALWRALYESQVDVLLTGHEHSYERFAPLGANGAVDPDRGVRSFVVGTGGRNHYEFAEPVDGSEARIAGVYGVLHLSLAPGSYEWDFQPVVPGAAADRGTGQCF